MALDLKSFAIGKANSGGCPEPTGSINITENGTYNVKDKAEAVVDVDTGGYEDFEKGFYIKDFVDGYPTTFETVGYVVIPQQFTRAYSNQTSILSRVYNIILNEGITEIELSGFRATFGLENKDLRVLKIPSTVENIGENAFSSNRFEGGIIFKGTPLSIASNAFTDIKETTIKVPWSEGEVENAPWGATNATIIYNYTGE